DDRSAAIDHVLAEGLASLAERWTLHDGATGETETVCIVEVRPGTVTLALGHYSLPGVPTRVVATEQLVAGEWRLERQQPSA
ncbi:MAG: hypothetical protein MUE78_11190, partial [Ilumatobacteraceae bacterium]|nr:hypothetical protein [Ilumatobacteraceae bacterium]